MRKHRFADLKDLLELKYRQYHRRDFIENDPVLIPHNFTKNQDIEIAGFFAATIAWGNRRSIIANASKLMSFMDNDPHAFVTGYSARELKRFHSFVHRTFNGQDCVFFMRALRAIYSGADSLESAFIYHPDYDQDLRSRIMSFREIFFSTSHSKRSEKHISDPSRKSAAKRLCMFLRWMVRSDGKKVDFGIWKSISPAELCIPLDVHTGNVGRGLGLLKRRQNDWQAVEELTSVLREFDPKDPLKYDFALFGMGVNKDF